MGASKCGSRARSECELAPQCPQQVQRPTYRYWRASRGGGDWLWLTVGARTLTEEGQGKYAYYYYTFLFVSFCSVVGGVAFIIFSFIFNFN